MVPATLCVASVCLEVEGKQQKTGSAHSIGICGTKENSQKLTNGRLYSRGSTLRQRVSPRFRGRIQREGARWIGPYRKT